MNSSGWQDIDPAELGGDIGHLMNAMVVPRPIAWVSTVSAEGVSNIAPHSYFTVISANPPVVCFSSSGIKDTLLNARHSGDFVVNVVSEDLVEAMNLTSADFPPGESEFAAAGLTAEPSDMVKAPRLAEAPASLECVVTHELNLEGTTNYVVFGRVLRIHVANRILGENGRVDPLLLKPVGRLAGAQYSWTHEVANIPRPTYAGLVEAGIVTPTGK